jgi:hypothetical protein
MPHWSWLWAPLPTYRFRPRRFQIVPSGKTTYPTGNQLLTPTSRNFSRTAMIRNVWSAAELQAKNEEWQMVCANVFGL